MKSCLLILFLTFVTICFSQENKLDSIRWIRIPNNSTNKCFFQDNYSNRNFSTLIGCFWESARNSPNVFFIEHSDIAEKQKLYFELEKWTANDSLRINSYSKHYVKNTDSIWKENIVFNSKEDHPFLNESGNDYEIDCYGFFKFTSGLLCFWYPPEFPILLSTNHISEIRIREELEFNNKTKTYEYIQTAIQLYTHHRDDLGNNIWLDLIRLKQNNSEIVNTEWFQDLMNKYYSSEQYMQIKVR